MLRTVSSDQGSETRQAHAATDEAANITGDGDATKAPAQAHDASAMKKKMKKVVQQIKALIKAGDTEAAEAKASAALALLEQARASDKSIFPGYHKILLFQRGMSRLEQGKCVAAGENGNRCVAAAPSCGDGYLLLCKVLVASPFDTSWGRERRGASTVAPAGIIPRSVACAHHAHNYCAGQSHDLQEHWWFLCE